MNYSDQQLSPTIAVVIPCYRVSNSILDVIAAVGPGVDAIYVVDDACPELSGGIVEENTSDPRVTVIYKPTNEGVGGATLTGIEQARKDGAKLIVKIDGDGQMDAGLIPFFCSPILAGEADYTKGNRFFEPESVLGMPWVRVVGNMGLSFLSKFSSGYWHVMDPTNGFFAIHGEVASLLRNEKIAKRFFFESDLLFRLNLIGARIVDIPMDAHYADEKSNLNPFRELPIFAAYHLRNAMKRIFYSYFIRGFSLASIELLLGLALIIFGFIFGLINWTGEEPATAGTVMLAALPIIVGVQFLMGFLNYDINATPSTALHPRLSVSWSRHKFTPRIQAAKAGHPNEEGTQP